MTRTNAAIASPTDPAPSVQLKPVPAPPGKPARGPLFKSDDWLATFLGLVVVGLVLLGVRPDVPKLRWSTDAAVTRTVAEQAAPLAAVIAAAESAGEGGLAAAATALGSAIETGDRGKIGAAARALGDAAKPVQDRALAKRAGDVGRSLRDAGSYLGRVFSGPNLVATGVIGLAYLVLSGIGVLLLGGNLRRYVLGFPVIYGLAVLAQILAGNSTVHYWGLEYVIFALLLGLFVSNVLGLPGWLREAVRTEFFIKTGLVILGAGILFLEIVQAGALGILQALLVVTVVWYACFWVARKLRVDDEFAVMLSTAVSICGVSAAIAACGAIQGDRKKLSYVTSLVLLVAVPMMVLMPWVVRSVGIPEVVAGAWLGGTLDTSGSVVAAGSLIGDSAMKAGVIVKFSQNVLLGVAAFALSVWWAFRQGKQTGERPSAKIIWERFPKFVLGFVAVSLVFSFLLDAGTIADTKGTLGALRTAWFALAFVCIGLETRLSDLVSMQGGRPALAFLSAQAFNVVWTLALAYLLFGGFIFSTPVFK